MIEDREQPRAPPVAREEQGTVRRLDGLEVEERAEILVGCGRVPEVELDALPHLDPIPGMEALVLRVRIPYSRTPSSAGRRSHVPARCQRYRLRSPCPRFILKVRLLTLRRS